MKTQKGNIAVIALIASVIVITAAVILWMFLGQRSQKSVISQSPGVSGSVSNLAPKDVKSERQFSAQNSLLYINEEFGFQTQLPQELSGYKVTQHEQSLGFWMPTSDQDWIKSNPGEIYGYALVFSIRAMPLHQSKEYKAKCGMGPALDCLAKCGIDISPDCPYIYLAENNTYALYRLSPQDAPDDVLELFHVVSREYLKQNIQLLTVK